MHKIAVLAMHGVVPFDLATPCEVFGWVRVPDLPKAYEVKVCGEASTVKAGVFNIQTAWDLRHLRTANTVIVPGVADITLPIAESVLDALRAAAHEGVCIASICTGAFVLAAAGLLDDLPATTHWLAAPELAARYPRVKVDPNVLFVDNGKILTSAGAAAGLDLCLHLVRRDYGSAVAANTARVSVMPLEREGGQAQFIVHEPPASGVTLEPTLRWLEQNLNAPLGLHEIAQNAGLSIRTLNRRFREQVGTTPLQWLLRTRICRAQQLLETTPLAVEEIAAAVGFTSPTTFREHFKRQVGNNPQAYRRIFGARD
jgi:transcriptional regulator GlxA family with amidase domain